MSYEFNPDSQVFEFPNPYKVENLALFITGGIALAAGLAVLWIVRDHLGQSFNARTLAILAIAIGLLLFGLGLIARGATQLRYFFGRNRPQNLAPVVAQDSDGDSTAAAFYKETLRQNALMFEEPKGALNGVLYSWLRNLIFAPNVIQRAAQTQFYNFLSLSATLLSFLVCWMLFGRGPTSGWIGLIYATFAFYLIIRPMTQSPLTPQSSVKQVGAGSLVVLIVLAVLGPVLLGLAGPRLPDLGDLSINGALLVALLCALAGSAVFGIALKNQLLPAPQAVGAARVTETVTMNAHPNKLIEELDRLLMARWYQQIPNRRYTRRSPQINEQHGRFAAEMLEETQPRPQPNRTAAGVQHALSQPQFRWLAVLTGLAMAYCVTGICAAVAGAGYLIAGEPVATTLALAGSQILVGVFCFHAANRLWGRFDFVSTLVWVDIAGSYESARMNIGNQIAGSVQTSKNVINIEAMTMRVWVSEIDSVIFGKDAARQMIGMRGLQGLADEFANGLKSFGESRSMVVAPVANEDMVRAQKVGMIGQLVSGTASAIGVGAEAATAAVALASKSSPKAFCRSCGAALDPDARFCEDCGKAVVN